MSDYGDYPDLSSVRRILVIMLRHHGDVLLTSPVFNALRTRLPDAEIFAYTYKDTRPMLEGHPAIDGFHVYDLAWKNIRFWGRAAKEIALIRQIRNRSYDLVLNLTEGDRGALAALFSGARIREGLDPREKGLIFKNRLYTHIIRQCHPFRPRPRVEQNLDAVRRIGIFPTIEERDLYLHIPSEIRGRISSRLAASGLVGRDYVLIHPSSRLRFKCWPAEKVAELIRRLHQAGRMVVLSSGPDPIELEMISRISDFCVDVPFLNLAGALGLKEFCALVEFCGCLVCVDSVPVHIASALKVPVVALFGPSSEKIWGPWNNSLGRVVATEVTCRPCNLDGCGGSKVCDCLVRIPVEKVYREITELLEAVIP